MKARVKSLFVAAVGLFASATVALAQDGAVTGRVTQSSSGAPLANASVLVVGTGTGTITNARGGYRIGLAPGEYEIRVSLMGYATVTEPVTISPGETTNLNVAMTVEAVQLTEVVVSLDAMESRRVEIGTDVERFDAEAEVERAAIADVSDLLNARAPGVSIKQASGEVGAASTIRVRGATSLTQDNNPIIYVDGVRVSNETGTGPGSVDFGNGQTISRLDDINPADIANVQILKGPTAAALYGSEAAAGVIVIETKRGRTNEHRYSFTMEHGYNEDVAEYPDNYYNLTQFGGFTDLDAPLIQQWRPVRNPVTGDIYARDNPLENPTTSPFRRGRIARYNASLRGGGDDITYFTSARYETEEGTVPRSELERIGGRANIEVRPSDEVEIRVSSGYTQSRVRMPDNDRSALGTIGNGGVGLPIFSHGVLPDGSKGDCLATIIAGEPETVCDANEGNITANFDKLATILNEQEVGRFIGSVTTLVRPTDWLSNRFAVGLDHISTRNYNLIPLDGDRPFGSLSDGYVADRRITTQILSADYAGTVSLDVADRLSSASTLGAQYFRSKNELVGCTGDGGFGSPSAIACDAALTFTGLSDRSEIREGGIFATQRFGFNDYVFVTGGVRVDDNSAFGENQGAIWSPSANASAVLSEMPFWSFDHVNNLRVRFAWGTAAQAPEPFAHARTFRPVRLLLDGEQVTGISPLAPGNPDLTAERNREFELGIDAGLLDDRVLLKLTYYDQKTTDAIVSTDVPESTGFSASKFVNIGSIENHGIEALLTARVLEREAVALDVDFGMSTQDPIVASLGGELPILFGLGDDHQMFREGFAPGAYYGEVISHAERDADGDIVPGSIEYLPGNVDDPLNPRHRYLGRPDPTNEESLAATLTLFGDIRIYTLFERAGGYHKMDLTGRFRSPFIPEQTGDRIYAFRQAESTPAEQAMMEGGQFAANPVFVDEADYIKWRELTVAYELPPRALSWLGPVSSATLMLGARNLHTWTGYRGLDPELRYDGGRDSFNGAEFLTMPPPRSLFVRLATTF